MVNEQRTIRACYCAPVVQFEFENVVMSLNRLHQPKAAESTVTYDQRTRNLLLKADLDMPQRLS